MKLGLTILTLLLAGNLFAKNNTEIMAQNFKCKITVDTESNMMSIYDLKNNFIIKGPAVSMNEKILNKMITKPYKSDMNYSFTYVGIDDSINSFSLETRSSTGEQNIARCRTDLI